MSATQESPSKNLTMAERYQNLSTAQVMKYVGAESGSTSKKGSYPSQNTFHPIGRYGN